METEDTKNLVRPSREPDLITYYGSCYWWYEMIRVDPNSCINNIGVNQETGRIYLIDAYGHPRGEFHSNIQEAYSKYWHHTFEKFFTSEEE